MECFKISLLLLLASIGLVVRGDQTASSLTGKSFKLTLQPVLSNEFIHMFSPDMNGGQVVFQLTQTLFTEASTLENKFHLNFLPMLRINRNISSMRDGVAVARKHVVGQEPGNADAYIFLSADTKVEADYIPDLGVTEGHVCQKGSRPFSIVMWKCSDFSTARVLARHIGTLLKMKDDYQLEVTDRQNGNDGRRNCVTAATSKTVMGWDFSVADSWSKCSNDDFADYYKSVIGEDGHFCLEDGWCKNVEF